MVLDTKEKKRKKKKDESEKCEFYKKRDEIRWTGHTDFALHLSVGLAVELREFLSLGKDTPGIVLKVVPETLARILSREGLPAALNGAAHAAGGE